MRHMSTNGYDEHAIERAVVFLVDHAKERTNTKPTVLHSIRVATLLWETGAGQDAVIAALLHDLLEDTTTTYQQIRDGFGEHVAKLVEATTFDQRTDTYDDKLRAAAASFEKAAELGADALMVRAADLIDNSHYYDRVTDPQLAAYLTKKYQKFMAVSEPQLGASPLWDRLTKAFHTNVPA